MQTVMPAALVYATGLHLVDSIELTAHRNGEGKGICAVVPDLDLLFDGLLIAASLASGGKSR